MPYFYNEANGEVVNISDSRNPRNGEEMAETAMNAPTRAYKDAQGNWQRRGFRQATPAEIKAHQKREREAVERRAAVVAARKQNNAGISITSVDAQSLYDSMQSGKSAKASKGAKGAKSADDGE